MEDRILVLKKNGSRSIKDKGYQWFLQDDYVSSDVMEVTPRELEKFKSATKEANLLYFKALEHVIHRNLWDYLDISPAMARLITLDYERRIPHIIGRYDFAGGIDGPGIRLLEFNADTCTAIPESAHFQDYIYKENKVKAGPPFANLHTGLIKSFQDLKRRFSTKEASLLLTGLGHEEDTLNLKAIGDAARLAGFNVDYADFHDVVFADEGVFLEEGDEYVQYNFMMKMVPWDWIMVEDPELLPIIERLYRETDLVILNPAYTCAFQSKRMLSVLHEVDQYTPLVLPAFSEPSKLKDRKYVEKPNFGRLGENIKILQGDQSMAMTTGDFASNINVYQEYVDLYQDEDGDRYQAGMYTVDQTPACLSFRRRDGLILDDDAEFIAHVID
ncbi:MAG: glutathionylspermidine synthase family protein [Bacteroidota bacterium]